MSRIKPSRQRGSGGVRRLFRRHWRLVLRMLVIAAVLAGAGAYGYQTGLILAQKEVKRVTARMNMLGRTVAELEQYNAVLARTADEARLSETAWRRRYEALASGAISGLAPDRALLDGAGGLDAAIVAAVGRPGRTLACESDPLVKRFRVDTPVSDGGRESAGFADNRIVVSASGVSALSKGGEALAWFDPAQPVALTFRTRDGRAEAASGLLPLAHRMTLGDVEYRFNVSRAGRGYVDISGTRCLSGRAQALN